MWQIILVIVIAVIASGVINNIFLASKYEKINIKRAQKKAAKEAASTYDPDLKAA